MNTRQLLLRSTLHADIPILLAFEEDAETAQWIGQRGRGWHETVLGDSDRLHLAGEVNRHLFGFVVLAGLTDQHAGIECRRIVVGSAWRGTGLGRWLFRAVVDRCFLEHKTHRVWLDVKVDNVRAAALYRSEGFVDEGTLREAYLEPDGRRSPLRIMSILRHEWSTRA